ncbi:MAG: hypothetical protein GY909_13260 [Oligoflexia bacterium]|nr:hypothetical protein [Oligoflexia bacterium]
MNEKFDHQIRTHLKKDLPSSSDLKIKNAIIETQRSHRQSIFKSFGQTAIPLFLFFIAVISIYKSTNHQDPLEPWQRELLLLDNLDLYTGMEEVE